MPTVQLDPELHKKIKLRCVSDGTTIQNFVESALKRSLGDKDIIALGLSREMQEKLMSTYESTKEMTSLDDFFEVLLWLYQDSQK